MLSESHPEKELGSLLYLSARALRFFVEGEEETFKRNGESVK
jgi:hypothetical protein